MKTNWYLLSLNWTAEFEIDKLIFKRCFLSVQHIDISIWTFHLQFILDSCVQKPNRTLLEMYGGYCKKRRLKKGLAALIIVCQAWRETKGCESPASPDGGNR